MNFITKKFANMAEKDLRKDSKAFRMLEDIEVKIQTANASKISAKANKVYLELHMKKENLLEMKKNLVKEYTKSKDNVRVFSWQIPGALVLLTLADFLSSGALPQYFQLPDNIFLIGVYGVVLPACAYFFLDGQQKAKKLSEAIEKVDVLLVESEKTSRTKTGS